MTDSTRASEFVTDTMGLVLRIERRRLSPAVRTIFDATEAGNATVYVPAIVFAEILYLAEKHKISIALGDVAEYLQKHPHYREYPMSKTAAQPPGFRHGGKPLAEGHAQYSCVIKRISV